MNTHIQRAISVLGTQYLLADAIGVSQAHVNKMLHGLARVSYENAVRIETATGGVVKAAELRSDVPDLLRGTG